jgi:OmcA/MtrC family decaheme c-type cytochrome
MQLSKSRALALLAVLATAACSGSTGPQGPAGQDGADGTSGTSGTTGATGPIGTEGPAGANAAVSTVEQCVVCHGNGDIGDFNARHALTGQVVVSNQAVAVATNGTDLLFTFNVKVDGKNSDAFTTTTGVYRHVADPTLPDTFTSSSVVYSVGEKFSRTSLVATTDYTPATVAVAGSGNYSVTLVGAAALAGNSTYVARLSDPVSLRLATAVVGTPALARSFVSDQACMNCHGYNVFASGSHHGANPQGVSACTVCHVRYDSQSRGVGGDRLMAYVHGIHNSHNMPAKTITSGSTTVEKPAGFYARSDSTNSNNWFSIGFPGYMNNCSTCHDTAGSLTAAIDAEVSWSTCMSCHDSFNAFPDTVAGKDLDFHQPYTRTTDCTLCHNASSLPGAYRAGQFHDGLLTERSGLLWGGKDQSVVEGKRIAMKIASITPVGTNLEIKWNATLDGTAVDPCNTNADNGPVFFGATASTATGMVASNLSILRAYAQGNDWVNGLGTSPGQPGSAVNVVAGNTTCSANEATTKVAADTTTATKGVVSIQGKPQVKFAGNGKVIQVRSPSPAREFVVATGADPSASDKRRQIVSIDKCNACHLGSIYQHGGNRVDSVELCVMCHNPAANEKNNRVGMGVTAATSYDGKAGETYDFRYMIHAIHSAGEKDSATGEAGAPLVYYRSNGVYAFGSRDAIDALPNWPGAGSFTVYASSPATTRNHNEIVVHYPRALNDCQACHVNNSEKSAPNGTRSVAVTTNAGAAPWSGQLDDVLMGPITATCMSCHSSSFSSTQSALRAHAYQNGWVPSVFEDGRQTLIDAAK